MAPPVSPARGFVWLLIGLGTLGALGIDLYLPAAHGVAQDLGASPLQLQQVLSAYLIGMGVMNLWLGALADRLGRRPVMLWTTALFVAASLGCAQSTHMTELIAYRFVQGMAGGSGVVIALAMVRDRYDAIEAARIIGQASVCFVVAPAIAPWLGGWLYVWGGWRVVFLALVVIGASLLLLAWRELPETLLPTQRQSLAWRNLVQGYGQILGDRRFLLLILATNAPFNGFFLYVVASPEFLGRHLALQPTEFFGFFAALMAGVAVGSLLAGRWAGKIAPVRQVWLGFAVMALMSALNLVLDSLVGARLWAAAGSLMGYTLGWALIFPIIMLRLTDLDPTRRGLIAAMHGMSTAFFNAVVAGGVAPWVMPASGSLALTTCLFLALGLLAWWAVLRFHGRAGRID